MALLAPGTENAISPAVSESVRKPWAMVFPFGMSVSARSVSIWIHWRSSVASAKPSIQTWSMVIQSLTPSSLPTQFSRSASIAISATERHSSLKLAQP